MVLVTFVKIALVESASSSKAERTASETKAAIKVYSIDVAPLRSRAKALRDRRILVDKVKMVVPLI